MFFHLDLGHVTTARPKASVWDLDGKEYLDFTKNGVGACSLGHAYDPVDEAVCQAIKSG